MNQLHPGARWVFRLQVILSSQLFIGLFILVPIFNKFGSFFLAISLSYILLVIIIAEIYARMSYARWLYEITADGIKIEHGIIWKKYTFIPYGRVQNVDLTRGIVARLLGFYSVKIETAGGSGALAEGYIPALDAKQAEKIRELVMKKIKLVHRSKQGL